MRTRSPFEICAPFGIFVIACALSIPTLVIAMAWMTLGVCCLGYRTLADFPTDGVPHRWRHGMRGGCLLFYHLAGWPWYMRHDLRAFARHSQRFTSGKRSRNRGARADHDANGKHH
ncbi:hypothetical protein [Paraburkholderia unamae]|uniref:Uncharacterized protein n=1 Tax=Paraburkholderia unamae TaxID=219649 RepID=A0ABX5KRK4_9BURK|nr:hypothetical protein [Paraburkholderia unamae]PVX85512.1 hypothetical protein C7402_10380 [Paraburkholderia unamae]RAR55276.1 hypothetical protein C7401_12260 [Paraburkholderia unamae]CAG9267960.1 conserved hypothetical protein [Paraburkholderia unamae]